MNKITTSKIYFQQLQIIHLALCMACLSTSIAIVFVMPNLNAGREMSNSILIALAATVPVTGILFSINTVYKKKTEALLHEKDFVTKIKTYSKLNLMRMITAEALCIAPAIVYAFLGEILLFIPSLFAFIYLIFIRPNKQKCILELQSSFNEANKLENPDEMLY